MREAGNFKERLTRMRAFAFDVDGVLSPSSVTIGPDGILHRQSNTRDGYAIARMAKAGIPMAIITGGKSEEVRRRYQMLGMQYICLDVRNKLEALREFAEAYDLTASDVLFMGDDIPDFYAMQEAGIAACPSDAAPEIVAISEYVSPFAGGQGCVRDVIEQYLKLHSLWGPQHGGMQ